VIYTHPVEVRYLGVDTDVRLLAGDVTDMHSLVKALEKSQAVEVYYLTAQSFFE
jgi:GDPmannose 4,6-dehydratase